MCNCIIVCKAIESILEEWTIGKYAVASVHSPPPYSFVLPRTENEMKDNRETGERNAHRNCGTVTRNKLYVDCAVL